MKKIVQHFRNAAELCNDYRDTVLYTGALAAVAFGYNSLENISNVTLILGLRETTRALCWLNKNNAYASSASFTGCAFLTFSNFAAIASASNSSYAPYIGSALAPLGLVYSYLHVGNVRDVYNVYKNTLFDFPRKQRPPRDWKKLFDAALDKLVERLKEALIPLGATEPARLTAQLSAKL